MKAVAIFALALALSVSGSPAVLAQAGQGNDRNQFAPAAPPGPGVLIGTVLRLTVKELVTAGYQIKAMSVVPHDIVVRGGSTLDVDSVILLLQNGSSLAQCYMTYKTFVGGSYYADPAHSCTVFE